ncbi:uncharacterized protein VNE69_05167 [Vairimorpha necatrix]|uniref:Uncharacterized protein n=1 Tax=Vairimorpha necatrix TaxID=6039 RepID=A0AAX4JCI1_9MICR
MIKVFEDIVLDEYVSNQTDAIVLTYLSSFTIRSNIVLEIINHLEKENCKRKNSIVRPDIIYEYIIDQRSLYAKTLTLAESNRNGDNLLILNSQIIYIKKNDESYINFFIPINNICCFFEVNVAEFDVEKNLNLIEVKTPFKNNTDQIICKRILNLYKASFYIESVNSCFTYSLEPSSNSIIRSSCKKFMLEIKNDMILFRHNAFEFVYVINNDLGPQRKLIITESCYHEFQEIFKKLHLVKRSNKYAKGFEIFSRLVKSEDKVEFLIKRILSKKRTALHILLKHLLFYMKIIGENEVNNNIEHDELIKSEIAKTLVKKLKLDVNAPAIYLITICLFLETEKYLKENDTINDKIFDSLKEIGKLIKSKYHKDENKNNNIDLFEIYQEIVNFHLKEISNYTKKVLTYYIKTTSLFTGLEENQCELLSNRFYTQNYVVLRDFMINKKEIEKNVAIIKKKLVENCKEDDEKPRLQYYNKIKIILDEIKEKTISEELEIKKNLRKMNKSMFNTLFNEIMEAAYKIEVDDLIIKDLTTKFEKKLREIGKKEIENTFKFDKIMKNLCAMLNVYDNLFMIEYENELRQNFFQKVTNDIKKIVFIWCEKNLNVVLVDLFGIKLKNYWVTPKNKEKTLHQICSILSKNKLSRLLNEHEGVALHNKMTKVLEDQEKIN